MRSFRILSLTVVISLLFVAAPTFAKVCHPKKPVTCDGLSFARVAAPVAVAPAETPVAKPVATTAKSSKPAPATQQAMLCGPWARYHCMTDTLNPTVVAPVKKQEPAKTEQAMLCGPWARYHCMTGGLNPTVVAMVSPIKLQ